MGCDPVFSVFSEVDRKSDNIMIFRLSNGQEEHFRRELKKENRLGTIPPFI